MATVIGSLMCLGGIKEDLDNPRFDNWPNPYTGENWGDRKRW